MVRDDDINDYREISMRRTLVMLWLLLATAAGAQTIVNGEALTADQVERIEQHIGGRLLPGRFWYDARAGLWGFEGGPTVGFAIPGLALGGPLAADASGSQSGVFMNGRQLHAQEIAWLRTLGPVLPGRYWLDAMGYVGFEGQTLAFVHLPTLAAQKSRLVGHNSASRNGTWVASGGGCLIVQAKSSSGIGNFGASVC